MPATDLKSFLRKILPPLKSKIVIALFLIMIAVISADLIFQLPEFKPYSKVIYANDGSLLTAYLSSDGKWRMRTRLDDVPLDLKKAILEKEDKWFYWHFGINPFAIVRALIQNISSGKRVSGASTITMQVARMLAPAERNYLNKFIEILRAFQLELHYSKDEILELYMSHLPFGGNIEGLKSASYIYFNRPPNKMSLSQSILLTVIPNDPNDLRLDKGTSAAIRERNKWIKYFEDQNVFPKDDLRDAWSEPVNRNRFEIKNEAPHFCRETAKKFLGDEIVTSLDLSIQKTAEKILLSYVYRAKFKMVSNGAVLIIDNKTNSISAYCGSADFNDNNFLGQVNGITALRSPGSTLKPFLYALAFDMGELTPAMKLLDIPTDMGGYEPENYDLKFNGSVTAKYALVNSLNVPAVRLLKQVGLDKFISLAEKGGLTDISQNKNLLGLSLILGGCGVRLEQLTKFFTVFSHAGKLYELNYIKTTQIDESSSVNIFSPASSYLTGLILTSNERPDYPADFILSTEHPMIAWKTGTSYGKRDAWAVGFNPDFTIGVWMGNFDGKGSPDLSGAEMAVPLLFELFNAIDYKPSKLWFDKPKGLYEREVCSETGLLPADSCKHKIFDYNIENVSPNIKCNLYKTLYVSKDDKMEYCPECLPKEGYKKAVFPFYDSELLLWFVKNKIDIKRPPPHNPLCQTKHSGIGPKIISPSSDYEYFIEENSQQQILLQAATDQSIKIHYWYVNDIFIKKGKPGEQLFFKPEKGVSKITCLDDLGRRSELEVKITFY